MSTDATTTTPACPVCGGPVLPDGFCPQCAVRERKAKERADAGLAREGNAPADDTAPAVYTAEQLAAHGWLAGDDLSETEKAEALADPDRCETLDYCYKVDQLQNSIFQPACVANMFATDHRTVAEPVFTMQAWINLDRARSPLIYGKIPATYVEATAALRAFGLTLENLIGESQGDDEEERSKAIVAALGEAVLKMQHAVQEGFAMGVELDPPKEEGVRYETIPNHFGSYLSLWTCLVTQCGLQPASADALEVGRARALVATWRVNHKSWRLKGAPYILRELEAEQENEEAGAAQQARSEVTTPANEPSEDTANG